MNRNKRLTIVAAGVVCALLFHTPSQAAETDQVIRSVKKPKPVQVPAPAASTSSGSSSTASPPKLEGRGVGRMVKDRTKSFGKEWASDSKQKIKETLQSLPTSRIFLTQLTMTAALPSVGDLLTKAMQQGQLGDLSQGATTQALSTLVGSGGGGGGGGVPDVSSQLLATCLRFGADEDLCIEDPKEAMKQANGGTDPNSRKLSDILSGAGVDGAVWGLLGDVEAGVWSDPNGNPYPNGVHLSTPSRTTYDLVQAQLTCPPNLTDPRSLACQILEASDGLPTLAAGKPSTAHSDYQEFWDAIKKLGVPFTVFKLYMEECKNALWDKNRAPERCGAVESLSTFVAVGETLQQIGGLEAQLADAEARTVGWELGYGSDPMFPMLEPYLKAALPRIRAMRQGLEASTGLTLAGYSERLQRLGQIADARDDERFGRTRRKVRE